MRERRFQISNSEWKVMKVIWRRHPITANQVVERLADSASWSHKTVRTLIARLTDKGMLARVKEGREYWFRPVYGESECARGESRSFLDKVFDGKVAPLLASLVESEKLSPAEIDELKAILDETKK